MMGMDDEIIKEFVIETRELLEAIEAGLISMEESADTSSRDILDTMFRGFHSIKGTAGFIGLTHVVNVTHKAENLLGLAREGKSLSTRAVSVLLDVVDFLTQAMELVENVGNDSSLEAVADALSAQLVIEDGVMTGSAAAPEPAPVAPKVAAPTPDEGFVQDDGFIADDPFAPADPFGLNGGSDPFVILGPLEEENSSAMAASPEEVEEVTTALPVHSPPPHVEGAKSPAAPAAAPPATHKKAPKKRSTIRVDLEKLDGLMNLVGELIIAENMVTHNEALEEMAEVESLNRATTQLNRVTRSLQDVVMDVRMVPISGAFQKMSRLIRDLRRKVGKEVRLEMSGEETEVDKTVVENIADPLVHMIRNSVDHGIELADVRIANGKSPEGVIRLTACHEGGEVRIQIIDDGKGLNRAAILNSAISKGLVFGDGDGLTDREVFALIFEPGFSTAEVVSDLSGRGVGMDVVRRNIERIKGRVEVDSVEGEGTTVTLRIPLTLAIIDGMLVRIGDVVYTVPMLSVRETVPYDKERLTQKPDGSQVIRIRDQFVPVVRLEGDFGELGQAERNIFLVVDEGSPVALRVDEMIGHRQTVIKPLPNYLGVIPHVSGCAVLSNGSISLIINVNTLARQVGRGL